MPKKLNEDELDNLRNGVCGKCESGGLYVREDEKYGVLYLVCESCGNRVDQPSIFEDSDGYDAFNDFIDSEDWMKLPDHLKY